MELYREMGAQLRRSRSAEPAALRRLDGREISAQGMADVLAVFELITRNRGDDRDCPDRAVDLYHEAARLMDEAVTALGYAMDEDREPAEMGGRMAA